MNGAVSIEALIIMAIALACAGAVMGFVSGLLGIGGGGILVPVLYEAFTVVGVAEDIRMHMAVGTSLAVIVPTSIRSFQAHRARGGVDEPLLWRIAPYTFTGVVLGILFAAMVDSWVLKLIWVVFGGALSLKMAFGKESWRLGDKLPRAPWVELYCLVVGIASVLMSIAGASFMVMFLTLYNRPILPAVATSSGLGPIVAIPGVIGFMLAGWGDATLPPLSIGYVSVLGAALIIPASVMMAPLGARVAHGLPRRALELLFAGFLGLVAVRFAFSLWG